THPEGVMLEATDGEAIVGHLGLQVARWPRHDAAPEILPRPDGMHSASLAAIDGALVIGCAQKGLVSRALLWRDGGAHDLTPAGFAHGFARDGAGGYQVGHVRVSGDG